MNSIYNGILADLAPFGAKLVAVSKRQPLTKINELYALGHRVFGENRVQEFLEKRLELPDDINWHLIGHLQTNKVKSIIGMCDLIHSVDRLKLAKKINQESKDQKIQTRILLQIKIAKEDSKFGYDFDQLLEQLADKQYDQLAHLTICGVMGMATFTEDHQQIRQEFKMLKAYFQELKSHHFSSNIHFHEVSMGMSGDYKIALEEGATIVRVGSKLFGHRSY